MAAVAGGRVAAPRRAGRRLAGRRAPRWCAAKEDDKGDDAYAPRYLAPLANYPESDEVREGEVKLPCFPLGGTYMPHSNHVLNIFEPRYRELYNDILMNGSRRFVVVGMDSKSGRLAETGVIFHLDDLREVSEQTEDQIKYVCQHKVIGRVRIQRVLNSSAWFNRTTYLRVAAVELHDTDDDVDTSAEEAEAEADFMEIVRLQHELSEQLHFSKELEPVSCARGDEGLWDSLGLWHAFMTERVNATQKEVEGSIQKLLRDYVEEQGENVKRGPGGRVELNLTDLPENLRNDLMRLQTQFEEDVAPLARAATTPFSRALESESHGERIAILAELLAEEKKRLSTKMALKSLFATGE